MKLRSQFVPSVCNSLNISFQIIRDSVKRLSFPRKRWTIKIKSSISNSPDSSIPSCQVRVRGNFPRDRSCCWNFRVGMIVTEVDVVLTEALSYSQSVWKTKATLWSMMPSWLENFWTGVLIKTVCWNKTFRPSLLYLLGFPQNLVEESKESQFFRVNYHTIAILFSISMSSA